MDDILQIASKAAIDQMKDNTDLANILGQDETTNKFWFNTPPPKIIAETFPYVQLINSSGGQLNDTKYDAADIELLILGTALDSETAQDIAGLIYESLHRQNIQYSDGWVSWSSVREMMPYSRVFNVQNMQYHQFGGYYRFRFAKG